jgi:hypothetical protein
VVLSEGRGGDLRGHVIREDRPLTPYRLSHNNGSPKFFPDPQGAIKLSHNTELVVLVTQTR